MASTLTISGDGQVAAALDRDRNIVSFYDMKDGQLLRERSMGDKKMPSAFNDSLRIRTMQFLPEYGRNHVGDQVFRTADYM